MNYDFEIRAGFGLTVLSVSSAYFTANVFESGPIPTPWNFLAGHSYQVVNSVKTKPRLAGN